MTMLISWVLTTRNLGKGWSAQVGDPPFCDPVVAGLPGTCAPESSTALAVKKGRLAPEMEREAP